MLDNPNVLRSLGAVVLVGSAVMFAALFVPFATHGCIFCPVAAPGTTFTLPSFSLLQGIDGWIVLLVVVALACGAMAYLMSIRQRAATIATLALSAVALAIGVFEGVDSAGRVVGLDRAPQPVELGGSGVALHGSNPPAYWDVGFYLFVGAAIVALVASGILVVATRRNRLRPHRPVPTPAPVAYGY